MQALALPDILLLGDKDTVSPLGEGEVGDDGVSRVIEEIVAKFELNMEPAVWDLVGDVRWTSDPVDQNEYIRRQRYS